MKKQFLNLGIAFTLALVSVQCGQLKNVDPTPSSISVPESFSTTTREFSFDFLQAIHKEEDPTKNFFVSPLSLHIALGMLLNGADGQTKEEIKTVLGFTNEDLAQINLIYKELIQKLPSLDPKVTNTTANSVWHDKDFTVTASFLETLKSSFNAGVFAEDFSNQATVDKINKWASDNTNAKIKKVIAEISPSQVMFLMNALYFKGDWKYPFDSKRTYDATFQGLTKQKEVSMMSQRQAVPYFQSSDYQAFELPYGSGNYVMTVVLPSTETDISTVIKKFNQTEWEKLQNSLTPSTIEIGLPKWNMEYSIKLNTILNQLGMPTAFSNQADLSKIAPPAGRLKVGFVKQDTFLAVDEKGTEAAAVTTIGIELTSVPNYPTVICDRPFFFFIHEKSSKTIQFMGKIVNL
jgi:serpin B